MAERTFLVKVDVVDISPGAVLSMSSRIFEELEDSGFPILSAEPWSAPAQDNSGIGSIPGQVEPQQPTTINPV